MTDETSSLIVQYEYDSAGRITKKTLGNAVYTTNEYDSGGPPDPPCQPTSPTTRSSAVSITPTIPRARVTSITTLDGTETYGYDALGQLTRVQYPNGRVVQYVYDAVGNRTQVIDNGVTTVYSANNMNQYTAVGSTT